MLIGYARVSTIDQNLNLQLDALKKAGCTEIFTDSISSAKERPGLKKALSYLRPGDSLVVWKMDRLDRSLQQLVSLMNDLKERNIDFISITQNIDTTTASGKLYFYIMAVMHEHERDLIRERTNAGLQAARARGKFGGRPLALTPQQIRHLQKLYDDKTNNIKDILNTFNIGKSTLYRYVDKGKREPI